MYVYVLCAGIMVYVPATVAGLGGGGGGGSCGAMEPPFRTSVVYCTNVLNFCGLALVHAIFLVACSPFNITIE